MSRSAAVTVPTAGSARTTSAAASPSPSRSAAAPAGSCPSTRLVAAALGVAAGPPARAAGAGGSLVCRYPVRSDRAAVVLETAQGREVADFASARARAVATGETITSVPRFFDAAWTSTASAGGAVRRTLAVRRGTTGVLVTSAAGLDAEKRLLGTLLD